MKRKLKKQLNREMERHAQELFEEAWHEAHCVFYLGKGKGHTIGCKDFDPNTKMGGLDIFIEQ